MILDVFGAAGNAIGHINPRTSATIRYSTGYTVGADGSQTPTYDTAMIMIEVQAASSQDIKQISTITQQDDYRVVYVYGVLNAINRALQIGGDALEFYGAKWLVTQQLEDWGNGDWSKVVVTRQLNS